MKQEKEKKKEKIYFVFEYKARKRRRKIYIFLFTFLPQGIKRKTDKEKEKIYIYFSGNVWLQDLTTMMIDSATPLSSRFRLTYQTLLLLHAAADSLSIETLLRSSFREAAKTTQRPVLQRNLKRCEKANPKP